MGEGMGESQLGVIKKKLSTLLILWCGGFFFSVSFYFVFYSYESRLDVAIKKLIFIKTGCFWLWNLVFLLTGTGST